MTSAAILSDFIVSVQIIGQENVEARGTHSRAVRFSCNPHKVRETTASLLGT